MRNFIIISMLFIAFFFSISSAQLQHEANSIYICSFNVYKLGDVADKYKTYEDEDEGEPTAVWETPQRIKSLANVLAYGSFDLIVLQEVHSGGQGDWALSDLVKELKDNHDLEYKHFISDSIGLGFRMPEAMGFLYKENIIKPNNIAGSNAYSENITISGRDLVRTEWITGDFDFTLISCHLAWGNEDHRDEGYRKIQSILTTPTPSQYSTDPDIIILGDFNRFGKRYDSIKEMTYDSTKYLIPNITIFDPDLTEIKEVKREHIINKGIPGDDPQLVSTTVAGNTRVYDIVFMTKDCDEEFPGNASKSAYAKDFGIFHFDQRNGVNYQTGADQLDYNQIKMAYSDHRPLWIRFVNNTNNRDQAVSEVIYVGTVGGSKFHLPGCRTIRNKETPKQWNSREAALAERGPCGVCKP